MRIATVQIDNRDSKNHGAEISGLSLRLQDPKIELNF